VFAQSPVLQDVSERPSDLGVFGLDKRVAAADEASSDNAAADDIEAAGCWVKAVVHTACVHYDCCTGQHKVANKGARAAPCRVLAYQRSHLDL